MNKDEVSVPINDIDGIDLKKVKKGSYFICKRMFDIFFGLLGIIFLIPLAIFVKLLFIFTGDFHSIFYSQIRIGKNGKNIRIFKFRSMIVNADETLKDVLKDKKRAAEYKKNKKLDDDPRITKAGKIIRKLSIDEFPQFINIFIGNMSLIGNRPYLPREKKDMGNYYNSIISTKPGLTGYWQVNGRSNTSFERRLKLESYYSNNYCFKLDLKIFFKTFTTIFGKNGAK